MKRHLEKGADTAQNQEILRKKMAAQAQQQLVDGAQKSDLLKGNESNYNECDTPVEVEALSAGRIGPVDTPIELERFIRTKHSQGKLAHNEQENNEEEILDSKNKLSP